MLTRYLSLLVFAFSFTTSVHAADMAFELRTYTTNEGKLPALQARFRDHTMRLFEKHGMKNIGYWVPDDKPLSTSSPMQAAKQPRQAGGHLWRIRNGVKLRAPHNWMGQSWSKMGLCRSS